MALAAYLFWRIKILEARNRERIRQLIRELGGFICGTSSSGGDEDLMKFNKVYRDKLYVDELSRLLKA